VASACAWSVALVGLEGRIVEVEADIGAGLPRTVLVGLPDSALYQARDRCKAAVSNSGHEWPISLLTINLSPATLPKAGSHYDLAIVAAILAAQGIFQADELRRTVFLGELGLDGRVRPVRGVLPATPAAQQAGFTPRNRAFASGRRGEARRRDRCLRHRLDHPVGRLSTRRADAHGRPDRGDGRPGWQARQAPSRPGRCGRSGGGQVGL
jgi:hypothetical protein